MANVFLFWLQNSVNTWFKHSDLASTLSDADRQSLEARIQILENRIGQLGKPDFELERLGARIEALELRQKSQSNQVAGLKNADEDTKVCHKLLDLFVRLNLES